MTLLGRRGENRRDCLMQVVRHQSDLRPSVARPLEQMEPDGPAFAKVVELVAEMAAAGVEIDEAAIEIAVKIGKQRHAGQEQPAPPQAVPLWAESWDQTSLVYYFRRGELIKIGTTVDPKARFASLVPDEILAIEPGGRPEEVKRHQQFAHLREGRSEYFRPGDDLLAHAEALRAIYGDPDPAWRTAQNVGLVSPGAGRPRLLAEVELPPPSSPETVTLTEAAERLGINKATLAGWIHRGHLRPIGRVNKRSPIYFLDHVRFLKSHSSAYRDTA